MSGESLIKRPPGRPYGATDMGGKAIDVTGYAYDEAEKRYRKAFARLLRTVLIERQISADELGAALGFNRATILAYERAQHLPRLSIVFRMALAMRCNPDDLIPREW